MRGEKLHISTLHARCTPTRMLSFSMHISSQICHTRHTGTIKHNQTVTTSSYRTQQMLQILPVCQRHPSQKEKGGEEPSVGRS